MSTRIFERFYAEYLLGTLEESDRSVFEEHLAECRDCRRKLAKTEELVHSLALAFRQQSPPARIKRRLMNSISFQPRRTDHERPIVDNDEYIPEQSANPLKRWRHAAMGASLLMAIVLGISAILFVGNVENQKQIGRLRSELRSLEAVRWSLTNQLDRLTSRFQASFVLSGSGGHLRVWGSAFVHHERGATIVFYNLPELSAAQEYQLWVHRREPPPLPSLPFRTQGTRTIIEVEGDLRPAGIRALVLTIEPVGGSRAPTGPAIASSGTPKP